MLAKETRNIIWTEGIILSMPKEAFMYLPSHLESHLELPILVYWAFVVALILFEQQPPQHRDLYYPAQNINQLKKVSDLVTLIINSTTVLPRKTHLSRKLFRLYKEVSKFGLEFIKFTPCLKQTTYKGLNLHASKAINNFLFLFLFHFYFYFIQKAGVGLSKCKKKLGLIRIGIFYPKMFYCISI